jgi:NAD(P)-dependent dehydrogenase (short-subunit alcohol dehydrogenase family)
MSVAAEGAGAQRVAAVSGGAGAIGRAIVAALAASGRRVVVIDRNAEISVDLTDEASTRGGAAELLDRYGRCDVLVHAAAAFDALRLADIDAATWRRVQAVNVESPPWLAQAFSLGMAQRGCGRIVSIASDTFGTHRLRRWCPTTPARAPWSGSCDLWRVRLARTDLRDCGGSRSYRYGGLLHDQHRCPVRRCR